MTAKRMTRAERRAFEKWRDEQRLVAEAVARLRGLQIGRCEYAECLAALARPGLRWVPTSAIGGVAEMLWVRSNRGGMPLADAVALLERAR